MHAFLQEWPALSKRAPTQAAGNLVNASGRDRLRYDARHPKHLQEHIDGTIHLFSRLEQLDCRAAGDQLRSHSKSWACGFDQGDLADFGDLATTFTTSAHRESYKIVRPYMSECQCEAPVKTVIKLNIILNDEGDIDILVDNCLPCFSVRKEATDLGIAKFEGIERLMQLALIEPSTLPLREQTTIDCGQNRCGKGKKFQQPFRMLLPLFDAQQMDEEPDCG